MIHLFPQAFLYNNTFIIPLIKSLISIVENYGVGVGIPGYPPFNI